MVKRVLMVAYHFPPLKGSSGIQRTLRFVQYLPQFGWEPIVLTTHPRAYPNTGDDLLGEIPPDTLVHRAFALDSARHLSVAGHYLRTTALPDRWITWLPAAVAAGLRLVRRYRPRVLWSTFPIATAHLAGLVLHRLTGLPWIADFRDPMGQLTYPTHGPTRRVYWAVERATVCRATRCVFTTPGTLRTYAARYPQLPQERWCLIENGYDEPSFLEAEALSLPRLGANGAKILLHSGLLYRSERNPAAFFAALAELRDEGKMTPSHIQVVLRASGNESEYRKLLVDSGLDDLVKLGPPLPYREALTEMLAADGLLLFQAASCNHQIPAKAYEYLRAGRPIFALTDPDGDTAQTLVASGRTMVVSLNSKEEIKEALPKFLASLGKNDSADAGFRVSNCSREERSRDLARVMDSVAPTLDCAQGGLR